MSPLATKIYKHLRKRVIAGQPSVTYRDLAAAFEMHVRSRALYVALGEVTHACRHAQLPALPATVWLSGEHRPASGYFKAAHPRAHTAEARTSAWAREHARVISEVARFPPTLA